MRVTLYDSGGQFTGLLREIMRSSYNDLAEFLLLFFPRHLCTISLIYHQIRQLPNIRTL